MTETLSLVLILATIAVIIVRAFVMDRKAPDQ